MYDYAGTMDYLQGQVFETYSSHNLRRLSGELPEKESSKAVCKILSERVQNGAKILEVGSSSGHLLRSLGAMGLEIQYVGVDIDNYAVSKGNEFISKNSIHGISHAELLLSGAEELPFSDKSFDICISLNVLEHLKEPRKAVAELIRCSKEFILIRTLMSDQTFIVQEARNRNHQELGYEHLELPTPLEEIDEEGNPRVTIYQNVYGLDFMKETLEKRFKMKKFKIWEDSMFSEEAFKIDNELSTLPRVTKVIGGRQVRGLFIDTNHWILIEK